MRAFVAAIALALTAQNDRPVHWRARALRAELRAGDTVRVVLHASIDEFFHLYSTTQGPGGPVRTTVEVLRDAGWRQRGALRVPRPDTIPDGNFGIMSEVYDDSVTFGLTLAVPANPGAPARIAVRFQSCTTRYCLPARTDTVVVPVQYVTGQAHAIVIEPPRTAPPFRQPSAAPIESFGTDGDMGAFLLLAASMGALALLTPCVFPMIPITVTSFLSTAATGSGAVRRAALYALGIVASFTGLGVLTAVVFGASGLARFSAHPLTNLIIAALFTGFALSLLGVVHLSLPRPLASRVSTLRPSGTLAMGVVFTLTAFTCTAPFVGSLLVMSSQGNWRWPLAGMVVFSSVFAAPFFLLALAPRLLAHRPRSAEWMPAVELVVGAIELGAAIKFLSNADLVLGWGIFTRQTVVAMWIAILIALLVALLARYSRMRAVLAAGVLACTALLIPGLLGRRLGELDAFLPPAAIRSNPGELPWLLDEFQAALHTAAVEHRPVLIDFTGYTCTNCRWMEANMFPRDDVKRALDRFVRVRLYTDGLGEPYQTQQALEQRLFGTVALPLYAVLDDAGRPRARFLGMTRDAREFVDFLDHGSGPDASRPH